MVEEYLKKIIKKINEFLGSVILFLTISNLFGNPELQCNEKSEEYSYSHSLSEARLKKIYLDIKKYTYERIDIRKISRKSHGIQEGFSDLKYTRIMHRDNSDNATIRLSFCLDQSIDIEVSGILNNQPIIKLAWGEVTRQYEVLWSYKMKSE
jgi:hypothetical protein